jgi:hypothetical protein
MSSCRDIAPGINKSPVDLNLLRANSLYRSSFHLDSIDRLLALNEERRGWLIFYTHDISMNPSAFGCKPFELEDVVKLAIKEGRQDIASGAKPFSMPQRERGNRHESSPRSFMAYAKVLRSGINV